MQHLQLQFEDPGFLSSPRSGCFTISSIHGARCSSCNVNASSHCRLPTMFLTAQAQLSRSKYNSGRSRKLELSKTQERSSNLLSRLAKEAFVERPEQSEGLTIAVGHHTTAASYPLGHQTAVCCPPRGALYPPPYKSVFEPPHVSNTFSSHPRPPPDGRAL